MNIKFLKQSLIVTSIAVLAACGGGGSSDTAGAVSQNASQTTSQTAADSQCFVLTPGTEFTLSTSTAHHKVVQATFNGQDAIGVQLVDASNGFVYDTHYWKIDTSNITYLGETWVSAYTSPPPVITQTKTAVYSGNAIPLNTVAGKTININYSQQTTVMSYAQNPPVVIGTSNASGTDQLTLVGFEDLTLAGHTFSNTCKVSFPDSSDASQTDYVWYAKGFGAIRGVTVDAQGNDVANSSYALNAIIAAP
jgi:hypothetical protein